MKKTQDKAPAKKTVVADLETPKVKTAVAKQETVLPEKVEVKKERAPEVVRAEAKIKVPAVSERAFEALPAAPVVPPLAPLPGTVPTPVYVQVSKNDG